MRRILSTLIVSIALTSTAFAQDVADQAESTNIVEIQKETDEIESSEEDEENGYVSVTTKKYHNYFGLCSGLTYRYGISYRRWFMDDNFGLQLHVFPFLVKETDDYSGEEYTHGMLKAGLTFLKRIKSYNYVRLLYYLNGTLSYEVDTDWDYDYMTNTETTTETEEFAIGAATGPGFEFYVWRFSFDVFLGVSGSYNIDNGDYHILPAAETSIHFRF